MLNKISKLRVWKGSKKKKKTVMWNIYSCFLCGCLRWPNCLIEDGDAIPDKLFLLAQHVFSLQWSQGQLHLLKSTVIF